MARRASSQGSAGGCRRSESPSEIPGIHAQGGPAPRPLRLRPHHAGLDRPDHPPNDLVLQREQRAIDRSPSFALAHFILGVSRVFAGRAAQAIEPLQRGFRLNPNDPQAFVWMQYIALAHFLLGEHADAAERAAETVAMRPDYHVGYAILACSLAAMGSTAEARRAVDEMLRVQPNRHALVDLVARFADPADGARLRDGLRRAGWMEAP